MKYFYDEHLTKEEREKYLEWRKTHKCSIREEKFETEDGDNRYVGAIGGVDTFIFSPSSFGTFVKVKCACGKECTLSDLNIFT